MKREIYNLVMCNISAYYMAIVRLNEMKMEAYSLKGISETAINKGISGNAGYQNKINECVVFEKSIKEKFQAVSDALEKIDEDIRYLLIKSIVKKIYIPCRLSSKEMMKLETDLVKNIAFNLLGKNLYDILHRE
ncbi:Uncharacterised protein [[Eubacterium] infirmum]|nr:Uncharacterised protein [[Eubacterium] infirmum]STO00549.1 Uncharacterised protein [[Eubacterium] infirmum]STO01887.1 Uncharacterised protein [[Eubacterium] infirmum]